VKNIWLINHYAIPPKFGGLNRHYYFSKYLSNMGYKVKIFTASKIHNSKINVFNSPSDAFSQHEEKSSHALKNIKEINFDGVTYTFLKTSNYKNNGLSRIKNMLEFPYRVLTCCKKFKKPDVIYTSSPSPFAALIAVRMAKKFKIPIILEVRDLWPESIVAYKGISPKNPIIRFLYLLEKYLYKHANCIIFTMEGGKEYIKSKELENIVDLSKVYNINNGVDLDEYQKSLENHFEDFDLEDKCTFKVIYAGSIREVNHLNDLLDAAKIIQNKKQVQPKKIKFLIYGDGTEKKALEDRCNSEKIQNIIFKGHIQRKFIPYALSKADLNIITVRQTDIMRFGCSLNKLFDYMASGKPIVSNLQVNYDLIQRYNCGITTKTKSATDLANAIEQVYTLSHDSYLNMCKNARKAAEDYDYKLLTRKLNEIILSLDKKT
jgi:glycosyltransferase involved in cell wall biosynthesis